MQINSLVYNYTQFGLSSKYSYNSIFFLDLISIKANFAVRGPSSLLCSVCGVRRREVMVFVPPLSTPGGGGFGVEGVGLMYFLRNLLLCSSALSMYSGDG